MFYGTDVIRQCFQDDYIPFCHRVLLIYHIDADVDAGPGGVLAVY